MIPLAAFLILFGLALLGGSLVFLDTTADQDTWALTAAAWLLTLSLAGAGVLCLVAAALTFTA